MEGGLWYAFEIMHLIAQKPGDDSGKECCIFGKRETWWFASSIFMPTIHNNFLRFRFFMVYSGGSLSNCALFPSDPNSPSGKQCGSHDWTNRLRIPIQCNTWYYWFPDKEWWKGFMSLWLQSLDSCLYNYGEDLEERAKCILTHLSMEVPRSWWEHALEAGKIRGDYINLLCDLRNELIEIFKLKIKMEKWKQSILLLPGKKLII